MQLDPYFGVSPPRRQRSVMYNPKKRRTLLRVEVSQQNSTGHSELGAMSVPLNSLSAGHVNIRLSLQTEETKLTTEAGPQGLEREDKSVSSSWNDIAAIGPEGLQNLYLSWRQGLVSSQAVQAQYGPQVLEALHLEHLTYMNGELYYAASRRHAATQADEDE